MTLCINKDIYIGIGVFVQCLYALSLHLVAMVCGTTIPTFLENVVFTCLCHFCCAIVYII